MPRRKADQFEQKMKGFVAFFEPPVPFWEDHSNSKSFVPNTWLSIGRFSLTPWNIP